MEYFLRFTLSLFTTIGFVTFMVAGIFLAYSSWLKVQERRHINRLIAECKHRRPAND